MKKKKRIICFVLIIGTLLTFSGCAKSKPSIDSPVKFYYPIAQSQYSVLHEAIQFEIREGTVYSGNLERLLNEYLLGPVSAELENPFPASCSVVSLSQTNQHIDLTLSTQFARLIGIDLIIACACISSTIFGLSNCNTVRFSVNNFLLDGNQEIIIHRDDILTTHLPI